MKKIVAVFVIGLMAVIVGCGKPYVVGKPVNEAKLAQIQLGKSTADQVVSILGKPEKVEPAPAGGEKYIYYYYQDKPTRFWRVSDVQEQRLEVTLKGGIVERVNLVGADTNKARWTE